MYDLMEFENYMVEIKNSVYKGSRVSPSTLDGLRKELNKFFNDSTCTEMLFTNNTDKEFFGMCVFPSLPSNYLVSTLNGRYKRFDKYMIEMDSRLFSSTLSLSPSELVAVLLHEVGHVVNDTVVSREVSNAVTYLVSAEGITIDIKKMAEESSFLEIGVQRAIRKITSIFERNDEEFIADKFVVDCGYGKHLETAYDKIITNRDRIALQGKGRFTTLYWTLGIYRELNPRRLAIASQLKDAEKSEGSQIYKTMYGKVSKRLSKNTYVQEAFSDYTYENYITELGIFKKIKFNTIKDMEDDLYEFNILIKNIETEQDALDLMRSISLRMSIINEYLNTNKNELSDSEVKRLNDLYKKFSYLRDEITRKSVYSDTIYGLYVKFPDIKNNYR